MSLPLRHLKSSIFKIARRYCRPYSAQVDGLCIDGSLATSSSRERQELHFNQTSVSAKVVAILEEGKKIANSICGTAEGVDRHNQRELAELIKRANDLQAHLTANAIVPFYNFYDASAERENLNNKEKCRDVSLDILASTELLLQRLLTSSMPIQSYSYAGEMQTNCNHGNSQASSLVLNGQQLDQMFNIDSTLPLPQHLFEFVRENFETCRNEKDIRNVLTDSIVSPQRLFLTELESLSSKLQGEHLVTAKENPPVSQANDKTPSKKPDITPGDRPKPSQDHLVRVHELMTQQLPKLFISRHDYRIYRPDVVFENNFYEKGYITKGIGPYVVEIAKLRVWAHLKYANVKMALLKSTIEEEEGIVTFHWRISGIPQLRAFMFWKFLPWTYKKSMKTEAEWYDGISTFYVDGTGLIQKHKLDRIIVDKDYETVKPRKSIREKLNKLITPKPAIGAACKVNNKD